MDDKTPLAIPLTNGTIPATRYGNGEKLLIAIHGYDDSQTEMQPLAKTAATEKKYTVYTLNLPYHGDETDWKTDVFSATDCRELIEAIRTREPNLPHFDLIGYSLGGRVVQSVLPLLAQKPRILYLLAPAGAPQNPWHPYLKTPLFYKKMMATLAQNPSWIIQLGKLIRQLKLISSFQLAFAEKQLGDAAYRKKMFFWWQSLHYLPLNYPQIQDSIAFNKITVHLLFGKKDIVIPKKSPIFFEKMLRPASIEYVNRGHRGVQACAANWLKNL